MASSSLVVQLAVCDRPDATKPVELPLPITHLALLDAARKKFKSVSKQSRFFDGVSGIEIEVGCADVELAGSKVVCSSKAGWRGADRLRMRSSETNLASLAAESPPASAGSSLQPTEPMAAAWASPRAEERATVPPVQVQFVSFSYDHGQPRDTLANLNARSLPNPGRAAKGRTGLNRRLAREVLATAPAAELCERLVQEALRQLRLLAAAADASPPGPLRLGVGCDRGLHRSVAVAEAATAQLARRAEKARSGRNRPGLEALLKGAEILDTDHRELQRGPAGERAGCEEEEEEEEEKEGEEEQEEQEEGVAEGQEEAEGEEEEQEEGKPASGQADDVIVTDTLCASAIGVAAWRLHLSRCHRFIVH